MTLTASLLAIVVGISETCATNGNVVAGGAYAEAVRKAGDIPVVICRTAKPEDFDKVVEGLDLLILTGGEDVDPTRYGEQPSPALGRVNAVRDEFEDRLLCAAVRHELPVVGTCRGVQHLNVFFGGTLHQDLPSDLGERYVIEHRTGGDVEKARRERRHEIAILPGSRLAAACGTLSARVNSLHHQAVKGLAPGMTVSAWAPDGVVEAIECSWYPAAGIQFHPECLDACNADPVWERFYSNLRTFAGRRPQLACERRPIGVFDSGVGGLSVLERLLTLDAFNNATGEMRPDGRPDFEDEVFVYLGDQANMPYGRYDAAGKADFLRELVVRDAQFVLGSAGHDPAKVVVIACNTATAYGLNRVKSVARPHDADVIGVVNAGTEAALDALKDEGSPYAIGVMATPATIASGAYERAIRAELKRRHAAVPVEIASRGGIGLADAVENAEPGMYLCARTNLVALVEEYRARGGKAPLRAIILGCTHYPFVLDEFKRTLADLKARPECAPLIAEDLQFVDPAVNTAIQCYRSLRAAGLLKPAGVKRPPTVKRVNMFVSVGTDGDLPDSVKYGRDCGCRNLGTKVVPLAEARLEKGVLDAIVRIFPACARELGL